jgi:hypothetical protein
MGCKEDELPKLTGPAGCKWFQRWRNKYNIVKKVTGMEKGEESHQNFAGKYIPASTLMDALLR